MSYRSRIAGDSLAIATSGSGRDIKIRDQPGVGGIWPGGVCTKSITFFNNNAAGGATVYVGANGSANFPVAPQASLSIPNVEPGICAINDRGIASDVRVSYGGEPEPGYTG